MTCCPLWRTRAFVNQCARLRALSALAPCFSLPVLLYSDFRGRNMSCECIRAQLFRFTGLFWRVALRLCVAMFVWPQLDVYWCVLVMWMYGMVVSSCIVEEGCTAQYCYAGLSLSLCLLFPPEKTCSSLDPPRPPPFLHACIPDFTFIVMIYRYNIILSKSVTCIEMSS